VSAAPLPPPTHAFRIEVDGIDGTGRFTRVEGLEVTVGTTPYRAGDWPSRTVLEVRGLVRIGPVQLVAGVIGGIELWQWVRASAAGVSAVERSVTVDLLDAEQSPVRRWLLTGCLPTGYLASPLDAQADGIALERVTLAVRELDIQAP
jgi:phage tail-like protein